MIPKLKIIAGPRAGELFEISAPSISVGRAPENHIVLRNSSISRTHFTIELRDGAWFVSDRGSLNGTKVNGADASGTRLNDRDTIVAGDFTLRFFASESAESSAGFAIDDTEFVIPANSLQIRIDEVFGAMARDLTAILKIANKVNAIRDPGELELALLDLILEVVPAETGAIVEVDDRAGIVGSSFRSLRDDVVTISRSVVNTVVAERSALLAADVSELASESLVASSARSLIAVPMVVFERPVGVIYLSSSASTFDEGHLRFLTAVAAIAGVALENARAWESLASENERLRGESFERTMLGDSEAMRRVHEIIRKVAPSGSNVLIDGESGTGKELAARAIHLNSPRSEMPFVAVNCAALTETLLESELFGHEKGAFTGAVAQKKGRIEMAAGGTFFLDEIGEMDIALQAKLLRVLQEREFERVGGTRSVRADIRLVAATNRDLQAEVAAGRFRQDLYFRLNVVRFTMPPLRARRDDIPAVADHFIRRFSAQMNRRIRGLSAAAKALLMNYEFPGNVRELENAIERAVVLGSSEWILPEDLPDDIAAVRPRGDSGTSNYHETIRETKRQMIVEACRRANGSYVEAAKLLGVHPNYLHRLIRNLELKDEIGDSRF